MRNQGKKKNDRDKASYHQETTGGSTNHGAVGQLLYY